MSDFQLIQGDCLDVMRGMDANSIDTIITDPPYGLEFMGKDWDKGVPGIPFWEAALRVAKPGTFLLAFGGTRTVHRLTVAIEDAGWEIRDQIVWLYGSGFPKSHNISKAIDKAAGAEREVVGKSNINIYKDNKNHKFYSEGEGNPEYAKGDITAPATPEAQLWDGWGTALKPAHEPIIVAMKPIKGTYAQNALEHGVAGLNIDGGRVEATDKAKFPAGYERSQQVAYGKYPTITEDSHPKGRWPANVILDEEAGRLLDEQTGVLGNAYRPKRDREKRVTPGMFGGDKLGETYPDKGGASRFFYCAKASKSERNAGLEGMEAKNTASSEFRPNHTEKAKKGEDGNPYGRWTPVKNNHPTVKPLALMRYLCELTKTPTGGVVLDPFMGSGSTGVACVDTGRDFIGIDTDKGYCEISEKRIEQAQLQERLF